MRGIGSLGEEHTESIWEPSCGLVNPRSINSPVLRRVSGVALAMRRLASLMSPCNSPLRARYLRAIAERVNTATSPIEDTLTFDTIFEN